MHTKDFQRIESYMTECMQDSAHDREHIYRVLYVALDIAEHENNVDGDVLIAACLLHDIGRQEQFDDPSLCHAAVGAQKASDFLVKNGFSEEFAAKVAACIKAHRFRSDGFPTSIEAEILFDSDKIDATGTLGIARTIFYQGHVGEPLYALNENGQVSDGSKDTDPSFFQEYKIKLEGLYSKFYTARGKEIALRRQGSAVAFYESMLKETVSSYEGGRERLCNKLQ
jgi:uncharacterized protein